MMLSYQQMRSTLIIPYKFDISNNYILQNIKMQSALKKQADNYFNSVSDFDKAHLDSIQAGKSNHFYLLLLSKYLSTSQLISKIVTLHTAKTIKWDQFINAVWGFSLGLAEDSNLFKALSQLISEIDRKNIVDRSLLMKWLPQNIIDAANLQKKQTLEKKAQRAYTKFYYDQKKHNLIRQSNEGYARLCLLLASMTPEHEIGIVWNQILSLIGNFDLDPDRVLDLLIESYVQSANTQICLNLIKNFNPQSIVALIGNRILKDCPPQQSQKIIYAGKVQNFLTSSPQEIHADLQHIPNPKLIQLACRFIKMSFLPYESLSPYLFPQDSVFEREQIKRLNNGKQKIAKSFKLMMQQLTPQQQYKIKQQENLKFYGQLLFSSKLAIFNGMVQNNDWSNFIQKFWNVYCSPANKQNQKQNVQKIDLIIYQPIIKTLLNMLEWVIDPLYHKISLNRFFKLNNYSLKIKFPVQNVQSSMDEQPRKQMTQCKSLQLHQFKKIVQLFDILKIYIGFESRVYIKICRLFSAIIKDPSLFSNINLAPIPNHNEMVSQNSVTLNTTIKQQLQNIIKKYLLPGMSLQSGNSALNKQLYSLLQLFDYRFRYRCYLYHYSEGMIMNPCLSNIFYKTRNKQIVIVNNLSDKNKKVFMKKMAKLTHNQALQTFYWIFRRILMQDYQKVVPQIVGVLANSCSLTLQMSIFIALHILNQQKQPAMNFKTGEKTPWFKNLINYISLFYRKYLQIDIQPVFDYIIMKIGQDVTELQNNQQLPGGLIGLLHQLLSKMFCNFVLKQINKNKLEMLAVGPCLQLQAMDISSEIKASKKSKLILQKFFWGKSVDQYDGQSLAISLLVLLTQKRAQFLHKSYISNLKILGDIYDEYTILIIQLIRVLNELSTDFSQYSKLLPENSLGLLINEYKLPIQIAFEIYRPSVKHISSMAGEEWTQFVNYIGGVMNTFISSQDKYIRGYSQNQNVKTYLGQNYSKITVLMSYQFFTTFWMLTLDSIYFPAKIYADKIEQVKKKTETRKRDKNQRSDRQVEKAKALLHNLKAEQVKQSKKVQDTTSEINLSRLKLDYFKASGGSKDDKTSSLAIQQFAQIFVQICLLPRMMLDPQEALYCMKITLQIIKINKLTPSKSFKLLIFIIQHVMNSMPYATQREAADCLAIFLSQIMNVMINWNDQAKLKQDMKKWLGIDEQFVDQNFARLKKQFIKLYVRFGNTVKSIRDEPYNIKNCLFVLERVDIIPAYRKQAQDLQNHLKILKQKYSQSLQTIIQRQLSIIGQIKKNLPVIQDDGQPPLNFIRNQMPTFSNLSVQQKPANIPSVSPMRSPVIAKNQVLQKPVVDIQVKPAKFDKKQNKQAEQNPRHRGKQQEKSRQKERQKQKQKYRQKQKITLSQTQMKSQSPLKKLQKEEKQQNKKVIYVQKQPKPIQIQKVHQNIMVQRLKTEPTVINLDNSIKQISFTRQITLGNEKKQEKHQQNGNSLSLSQRLQSEKPNTNFIVPQVIFQKKTEQQNSRLQQQHPSERIKTVKQRREQNIARKVVPNNPMAVVQPSLIKAIQPSQQIEKLKKQSLKDQAQPLRDQKVPWQSQNQKRKTLQTTVEFSRKSSIQDKKNQEKIQDRKSQVLQISINKSVLEIEDERIKHNQPTINPIIQIVRGKQAKQKEDLTTMIAQNPMIIKQQKKQFHQAQPSKSQDKKEQKEINKVEWKKSEKQDKYSQDKNQNRQRQYKRQNRPEIKIRDSRDLRDKQQRNQRVERVETSSRWKEDYRERKEEDRDRRKDQRDRKDERDRKDSRDRNRKKQDKYERERPRKNDHKNKDRSRQRQHQYRK